MKVALILLLIIPFGILSQTISTSASNSTTNSTSGGNTTSNSTVVRNSTSNSTSGGISSTGLLNVMNLPFLNNITLVSGNEITANPGQPRLNCTCPANMSWVCGNDGNSYSSACVANNCFNVSVAYDGRCLDCNLPCSMNLQPVCGVNNLTHLNLCHLLCISRFQYQAEGYCPEKADCLCVSGGPQVCGVDSNFYASECAADCAGMSLQPYARCIEAYPQLRGYVPNQLDCMHGSVNVNFTIYIPQGYNVSNSTPTATNNQTNATRNQTNSTGNATNNQTNATGNATNNQTNATGNTTTSNNGTSNTTRVTSVTNADGSITQTTINPDGSEIIVTTRSNGSVNTVLLNPNGAIISNSTTPAS